MAKQVRRWSHTRGSRDGGGGGGPRFFSSVERKWTKMEGENSRQGCEFERLGVDDIYAHRSRHQFITYSFSRARFLLPIFLPASCSPSSLHESLRCSQVQTHRQIWFEVARTNLPSTASKHLDVGSTINLTENQLRNDFIDRANLP